MSCAKKKTFLFCIVMLALLLTLFACTGAPETEEPDLTVKSISVVEPHVSQFVKGSDIDLSVIKILVTYSDNSKEEIPLDFIMLSEEDRALFNVVRTHSVIVNYEGKQCVMQFEVVSVTAEINFTAQFFTDGGTSVPTQVCQVITGFIAPEKEGHIFGGWYTNLDFLGDRAVAPYILTKNTNFYARWIDDRYRLVSFYDDEVLIYEDEVRYGTGIDLKDLTKYPAPAKKEGKEFSGWQAVNGDAAEITVNLHVVSTYEGINCLVEVYTDVDAVGPAQLRMLKYGDMFNLSAVKINEQGLTVPEFPLPVKDGHQTRWVAYIDGAKEFTEWPVANYGSIYVTRTRIVIKPLHVINTYSVSISNAAATQDKSTNLKAGGISGNIALERVYENAVTSSDFTVNWGTNFDISNYNGLTAPRDIYGYNSVWCIVVQTDSGEEWINAFNQRWDEESGKFVPRAGGTRTSFDILDRNDEHIVSIEGNYNESTGLVTLLRLTNIRGAITVKAKYTKIAYTVTVKRNEVLNTFTVRYLDDFALYDPELPQYSALFAVNPNLSAADIERSYLKNNVALWLDGKPNWNEIYQRADNTCRDDWKIEWYTESLMVNRVDFLPGGEIAGTFEIQSDLDLFCKDIDIRLYEVTFYYDYDFQKTNPGNTYNYKGIQTTQIPVAEFTPLTLPTGYAAPIAREYVITGGKNPGRYEVWYEFSHWADYPYNDPYNDTSFYNPFDVFVGEEGYDRRIDIGFLGEQPSSVTESRRKNSYFYAHYICRTTFTLKVYDQTQKNRYDGIAGFENYTVYDDTIEYILYAGDIFDSKTMLYKGRINVNGATLYNKAAASMWFKNQYKNIIKGINDDPLFGNGDQTRATAKTKLREKVAGLEQQIENAELLWQIIYSYGYNTAAFDYFDSDYYDEWYMSHAVYNEKRGELYALQLKLKLIENYETYENLSINYDAEEYHKYTDSYVDLNAAYGFTNLTEKQKFSFAGWFEDERCTIPFSGELDFSFFFNRDLELYAKWMDEEKGSDGLVFEKIIIDGITYVMIVDYLTEDEYLKSKYNGCGFNNLQNPNVNYSVNFDEYGNLPRTIMAGTGMQIPSAHGNYDGNKSYPLIGIRTDAFLRHASKITTLNIPDSIMFVEEGAFKNVKLSLITVTDNNYVGVDDSRALYQKRDFPYIDMTDVSCPSGSIVPTVSAWTLVLYATEYSEKSYYSTLPETTVIGKYAFESARFLKTIQLNVGLTEIHEGAFNASAITGSGDTPPLNKTLVLPYTLVSVDRYAFRDCAVSKVEIDESSYVSNLQYVHSTAFSSTLWVKTQVGAVTINGVLVGIGLYGVENDFKRDNDGNIIIVNGEAFIITGSTIIYYYYDPNDRGSTRLSRIVITEAITNIADDALANCGAEIIEFADASNLQTIGNRAFANCLNLTEVRFNNLTNQAIIGSNAFANCGNVDIFVPDRNDLDASWADYIAKYTIQNI